MTYHIPSFYPIVHNKIWVEKFSKAGVKFIQLRIKDQPIENINNNIKYSLSACLKNNSTLVVNDYWQLAIECNAKFIHLGQKDLLTADIKYIKKLGIKIGVSTHNYDELDKAMQINPDYIALGPIYKTTTKIMPWQPHGVNKISIWKKLIGNIPLVAIGGITLDRAPKCFENGADSVAVITAVLNKKEPLLEIKKWLKITKQYS